MTSATAAAANKLCVEEINVKGDGTFAPCGEIFLSKRVHFRVLESIGSWRRKVYKNIDEIKYIVCTSSPSCSRCIRATGFS